MDPLIARKTWRTVEPIHGLVYFAAEADEAYVALGLPSNMGGYFASRAAPMGPASAELVIATFFNFFPDFVRRTIPWAWTVTSPAEILAARVDAAGRALRRALGDLADGPDVAEAAELARRAALAACEHPEGRPLFAGHASLDWPEEPLLVLWHAQTLLREFRGDGHISAMTVEGVTGLEALIIHGGTGEIPTALLQATRAWPEDQWAAGEAGLRSRGWLDADGGLTEAGRTTDLLALPAYEPLGDDGCARLRELCRPLSKAVVSSGSLGFGAPAKN
jgi:hypothetical protein